MQSEDDEDDRERHPRRVLRGRGRRDTPPRNGDAHLRAYLKAEDEETTFRRAREDAVRDDVRP